MKVGHDNPNQVAVTCVFAKTSRCDQSEKLSAHQPCSLHTSSEYAHLVLYDAVVMPNVAFIGRLPGFLHLDSALDLHSVASIGASS